MTDSQKKGSSSQKPHTPYIMPDGGKRLADYLRDTGERPVPQRKNVKLKGEKGWESKATGGGSLAGSLLKSELEALRLGREKRTRYLNDRILRDMAGATTAQAIEALFKPAPFGETGHETPLQQALLPENAAYWDSFRTVDPDKQAKILQKWEEGLLGASSQGAPTASSAFLAMKAWATINRRSRDALKAADPGVVDELELPILHFLDKDEQQLVLELKPWQRLLVHGIAEYHSLSMHRGARPKQIAGPSGVGQTPQEGAAAAMPVYLRKKSQQGGEAKPAAEVERKPRAGSGGEAEEGASDGEQPAAEKRMEPRNAHEITVADILFALEDHTGGLTPARLAEYVNDHLHPDRHSESEASYILV